MKSKLSYLKAIQDLPGDTAAEKFKWIAKFVTERIRVGEDIVQILESEKIPHALLPLVKVEAVKILKNHELLAESLKSEDALVISRALQATWFFDGSRKDILNVDYFLVKLFPDVTLSTRGQILKVLAKNLARNEQSFAEEFFLAMSEKYGLVQAIPMLAACRTDFTYNIVIERQVTLPCRILKTIFRREPDFVIRYLRLTKPTDVKQRKDRTSEMYANRRFLPKLVKKNLEAFVELYEMHENYPPSIKLSAKCAEYFVKNGKEYLMRKPRLYIDIVPLKSIDSKRMELLFPKLLPDKLKNFNILDMFKYLEYYPEDQKAALFLKSYKDVYGIDYLEDVKHIQPIILKILPRDERIKQARRKIETIGRPYEGYDLHYYERCWWCYLPTEESLPAIKEKLSITSDMEDRSSLLKNMLFTCKVNNDSDALLETLNYINTRHKNEPTCTMDDIMQCIMDLYDLTTLNEAQWAILYEMLRRGFVKDQYSVLKSVNAKLLEGALYFKLTHDQPIDQVIDMLTETKASGCTGKWNVLIKYPEYERKALESCLKVVEKNFDSDVYGTTEIRKFEILADFVVSIYDYNDRHVKPINRVERLSLKNYSWLLNKIRETMFSCSNKSIVNNMKLQIEKHEIDVYKSLFGERNLVDVFTGEASILLKKDPQSILDNWEEYLKRSQDNCYRKHVWQFIRKIRWYKDIPIKFAEKCLKHIEENKGESAILILALLLHGQSFADLIEPLLPSKLTIEIESERAKSNYVFVSYMVSGIKVANPPVPLKLIERLCEGDYLGKALEVIENVIRRTSPSKVLPFILKLSNDRVSVRKHGIRLFCKISPLTEISDFLLNKWKVEDHPSIREVLYYTILDQLYNNPCSTTWSLFVECASSFTIKDRFCLSIKSNLSSISTDYIVDFIKENLKILDKFTTLGVEKYETDNFIRNIIHQLDIPNTNLLPEELCEEFLNKYLYYDESSIAVSMTDFLIDVYLSPLIKEKFDNRLATFQKILLHLVKEHWDVRDLNNQQSYYPLNRRVRAIFDRAVGTLTYKNDKLDAERLMINGMLNVFLSVLSPQKDPESFLKMTFSLERLESEDSKQFSVRIARKLPELIEIYTPNLTYYITISLKSFLRTASVPFSSFGELSIDIMEALLDSNDDNCLFAAANIMVSTWSRNNIKRYENIVKKLRERNDPAITSILYTRINNSTVG